MQDRAVSLTEMLLELAVLLREAATKAERTAAAIALVSPDQGTEGGHPELEVDRKTLAVRWNGESCFLGYTTAFRLIERLARRPNQYLSHAQLLDDVWGGPRSKSAIRSAINDLRIRLAGAGMSDLASAIDGSTPGHYGLIVRRLT